jgi:hypothetical protein
VSVVSGVLNFTSTVCPPSKQLSVKSMELGKIVDGISRFVDIDFAKIMHYDCNSNEENSGA